MKKPKALKPAVSRDEILRMIKESAGPKYRDAPDNESYLEDSADVARFRAHVAAGGKKKS